MGKNKDKKSKKDKKKNKKGSNKDQRVLSGGLAISRMKHVIMKKKGKKGKKIELICFPIDKNFFKRGDDGAIYMQVRVIVKNEEDDHGQHGFISQSVDSKMWKDADEDLQEKMNETPILGGIKDFSFSSTANDNAGSAGTIDENDDLPF